jgi:hypothetical protein
MSFNCQRAGTPRYRHCCTVRNFAPSSIAARSTSSRVRCIVGISIASPFQRERVLRQSVASLLRPKKTFRLFLTRPQRGRPDRLAATPYGHFKSLIGRTAHRAIAAMRIEVFRSIEIKSHALERMQRRITVRAAVHNSLGVGGRPLVEVIPDIGNGRVQTQLKISQRSLDSVNRAPVTSMAEEQRAKSSYNW